MARRSGRVRVEGLGELAKRLSRLGNAIPDAIQSVMDDTAEKAVVGLVHPLDDAADGGLTSWMSVKPGRASSSVRPSRRRRTAQQGVAEAQVYVNRQQSAAWKYLLENGTERDRVRQPGDIGPADEHLFVVRSERMLARKHGIRLTKEGNLPRSALKNLVAKSQKRGPLEKTFYGRPKGNTSRRSESQIGFWERPVDQRGGLTLLVEAIPQADYKGVGRFDAAWNEGIEDGAKRLPKHAEEAIEEAVRKASRPRGAGSRG